MTVYIDDIQRMFSIYSQFLIQLLTRNETKSLLVAPVLHGKDPGNEDAEVWGVIWMEFPNRLNRPESDLRDLAEFAAQSIQRQLITYLDSEGKKSLAQELGSLVPEHVLRKLRRGENPREVEEGYLLNIDLAGSTKLAGRIGDQAFSELIQKISSNLSLSLDRLKLVPQLIIWDAFIYTRSIEQGTLTLDEANDILVEIKSVIHDANQHLPQDAPVSFRAVLHYGDTTRDWNVGSTRSWTISGAALAESCKLESRIKDQKAAILISEACPIAESDTDSNFDDQLRILKTA
jgi:class 3 adenylate cyclase